MVQLSPHESCWALCQPPGSGTGCASCPWICFVAALWVLMMTVAHSFGMCALLVLARNLTARLQCAPGQPLRESKL